MQVESLIQETVELQGFRVLAVNKIKGELEAELAPDRRFTPRCGVCGEQSVYRDTRAKRRFRHVPLWGISVYLLYSPRRVSCVSCGGVHVESMPWARGKRKFTKALLSVLATWARILTWKQVARMFGCAWGTVDSAVEEAVEYGMAHRNLEGLAHIGIDEISGKRGHVYVTNVYDLKSRRLVWSGEGRAKKTPETFFDWLGEERTGKLEGVCCDMRLPYCDVVKEKAPQAVLVFDKFHIVQHPTKAVDRVRRDEIREKGAGHKILMAKSRYIRLKNPWNLSDNQRRRLSELEKLNLKITRAYLLKEAFRGFWNCADVSKAERYLDRWFRWATHSRLQPIRDFAWMLRRHQKDPLNYFRMYIHNGTVEGLNNKAKAISHKAYGFRTAKNYIRNLYHCMADLPLPKTAHTFA